MDTSVEVLWILHGWSYSRTQSVWIMYQIPRAQVAKKKLTCMELKKHNFNNTADNIQKKNLSAGTCMKNNQRTQFYQHTLQRIKQSSSLGLAQGSELLACLSQKKLVITKPLWTQHKVPALPKDEQLTISLQTDWAHSRPPLPLKNCFFKLQMLLQGSRLLYFPKTFLFLFFVY